MRDQNPTPPRAEVGQLSIEGKWPALKDGKLAVDTVGTGQKPRVTGLGDVGQFTGHENDQQDEQ